MGPIDKSKGRLNVASPGMFRQCVGSAHENVGRTNAARSQFVTGRSLHKYLAKQQQTSQLFLGAFALFAKLLLLSTHTLAADQRLATHSFQLHTLT